MSSWDGTTPAVPPDGSPPPGPKEGEEVTEREPEYPEGLHDAAKVDRRGPFWSSLGEPDVTTGARPAYLTRDDWHISSTYTPEERAAVEASEEAALQEIQLPGQEVDPSDDDDHDPFAELEYMKTEGVLASGSSESDLPMPQTWQEYQYLQAQISELADDVAGAPSVRADAERHAAELAEFYDTFKSVLAEGWTLLNNKQIEDASRFLVERQRARNG